MRTALSFLFCCLLLTANNALGQETYQLDGLEVTLPKGFSGHSRMMEGNLNAGFAKEGTTPFSQLILTITDLKSTGMDGVITDEMLLLAKDNILISSSLRGLLCLLATIVVVGAMACCLSQSEGNRYPEVSYPTPKIEPDTLNKVLGVVLHHTAEPTAACSLEILSTPESKVSTHIVIDYDGTRYIMAPPDSLT